MRKPAAIVFAALFLACDGGSAKDAFERYEKAVNPSLEAEAELRRQFDEKIRDYSSFGDETGFERLVKTRMVPFYTEMEKAMAAVVPEGPELAGLHATLLQYVAWRRELFDVFGKMRAAERALAQSEGPAVAKLRAAEEEWGEAGRDLNAAITAAPEAAEVLSPMFTEENAVSRVLFAQVAAMEQGVVTAPAMKEALQTRFGPHYEQLAARFEEAELPETVRNAARSYAAAARKLVEAAGEIADVREGSEGGLDVLKDRLIRLQDDVKAAYEEYRNGAKTYRDSLR